MRHWKGRRAFCAQVLVFAVAAIFVIPGPNLAGAAGNLSIKIIYAQASAAFTQLWVAQDRGFFARQGLDVGFAQVTGSAAVAALTSGEAQAMSIGGTEVADYDAAGGDLVLIAAGSNYPVFSLYVNKSIRTIEDLAGKKIAVTRTGTSTDTTARLFLEHFGLSGKVDIVSAGGTLSGIMAAMSAGLAAGGVLSPPTTAKAEEAGFKELVNGVKLGLPLVQTGLAVRRSYVAQNRDTVLRVLKAYVDAWALVRDPANAADVQSVISHYTKATPEDAAFAYKAFLPAWQARIPRVDPRGIQNNLRFSANAQVRAMVPANLIDDSLLTELVRSGYLK
ncbi:MAG TPA: ABC transporter substrate-binding protein [bacterium]|nr:ABC transporter substrate-binding protein [bacterium]